MIAASLFWLTSKVCKVCKSAFKVGWNDKNVKKNYQKLKKVAKNWQTQSCDDQPLELHSFFPSRKLSTQQISLWSQYKTGTSTFNQVLSCVQSISNTNSVTNPNVKIAIMPNFMVLI